MSFWSALGSATPKARQSHHCDACGRVIDAGEVYLRIRYVEDGAGPGVWKECAHCRAVRARIYEIDPAAAYYDEGIDLREYLGDVGPGELAEVAEQFRRFWRSALGELLPVPTWAAA